MAKTVYSLVLSDEVVREVDRLAYSMNTSRSNMINQILADYVRLETNEKRMQNVFEEIENLLMGSGSFKMLMRPSDSMMSIRSCLTYKYNPTIRYSIELSRQDGAERSLKLKILLRSQNQTLIHYMQEFFVLLSRMEGREDDWEILPARVTRVLTMPGEGVGGEELGERIAVYIRMIDDAMNLFFGLIGDPESAVHAVRDRYEEYRRVIDYRL